MKAAILEEINAPLTIANVELGELAFGQVLVKILVSGICGAQLQEIAGNKNNAKFVPHLLGHEGCGLVEDIGPGVTKVKKGDKVVMHWRKGEGIEADFPNYTFKDKLMRSGKVTTFSEYSIVSENRITPVPQDVPNDFCALLGCGLSTALGTISNEARVQPGESVMIVGLGGLGACFMEAARLAGASPLIGVDIHDNKRTMLESLQGTLFINSAKEDIGQTMQNEFGLKDVDVIIETSGNAQSIADTLPLLGNGGRYILVGQPKPGESVEIKIANHLFGGTEGKTLKATQGGKFSPSQDIPHYVKLYKAGLLKIENLVTHRTSLNGINNALDLMRAGKANRIMIDLVNPLLAAYKKMFLIRTTEQELAALYMKDKIMSFVHFYVGQEAVAVGVCEALQKNDKVLGNHRSHGHYLAKGGDLKKMICELLGKEYGSSHGKGGSMHMIDKSVNFMGSTPILGSVVPLACGSAFEQKYNKKNDVTVAFYGDGASEEGIVYETYNLAALFKLPILFVIENNLFSVNSKLKDRRSEAYDIEKIAIGFGLTYLKADGNDYQDIFEKAKKLLTEVRKGKPAVLECITYRHMAHSAPIFDEEYREEDVLEKRQEKDPIKKMRQLVLTSDISEEELSMAEEAVKKTVMDSISFAVQQDYPKKETLYTDLYVQ